MEKTIENEIKDKIEQLAEMRQEFAPIIEAANPMMEQLAVLEKEIRALVVEHGKTVTHAGIKAGYRKAGKPTIKWNTSGLLALAEHDSAILENMTEIERKPSASVSKVAIK